MASPYNKDYKGLNIPHPVLRCIQRALACTIFARGETIARANIEDLQLLDHMLRTEAELEWPDLMLLMISHWLDIQQSQRIGGTITIGAYVTHIAEKLEYPTTDDTLCRGPNSLDAEAFRLGHFIRIQKGITGSQDKYFWRMPDGSTQFQLPIQAPIFFSDRSSWLFTGPRAPPTVPPAPPVVDTPMPDAHASTSAAATDPSMQDLYRLMANMRATQLEMRATQLQQDDTLRAIQHRVMDQGQQIHAIQDELRDWRYYDEYEYYPDSGPSDF